jgi:hypothetical protein
MADVAERDHAARVAFERGGAVRRTVLYSVLIAAAFSSAVATAVMIPAVGALAEGTAASPRMAELVEMYRAVSTNIDALDPRTDAAAWTAAEQAWEVAEANLMNERPRTVCDFAAKFDALLDIESSEGEFVRLKRLSEDAHAMGGCAK